jgi:hypothetical protein
LQDTDFVRHPANAIRPALPLTCRLF